jgi:glycosyltransferase involved in cell wall biosynthesis
MSQRGEFLAHPAVTVLVATFNREGFIAESLESIFAQSLPPRQVIVINDGSTDKTKAALEPFLDRIEYVETENRGKPAALNLAMPLVIGDYVWIMDDDDVALPDALERHIALLEGHPEYGLTYSSFINSTTRRENMRILPHKEKLLPSFPEDEFLIRLMEGCFLIHPTVVVRTSCYREVGPFLTRLVRCQDYEMAIRLARKFRAARVVGPTLYHRHHTGARGNAKDSFNSERIYLKWLEYMQMFFPRLRQEMSVGEYLPGNPPDNRVRPSDLRRAYLQRMVIMARKRLIDEMIEDLCLSQTAAASDLSAAERDMLREVFCLQEEPSLIRDELLKQIRSVCFGKIGAAIRREFIRGLYWRAAKTMKDAEYRETFRATLAAIRLLDFRVLASFLGRSNT